jgi:hypothetical protein
LGPQSGNLVSEGFITKPSADGRFMASGFLRGECSRTARRQGFEQDIINVFSTMSCHPVIAPIARS